MKKTRLLVLNLTLATLLEIEIAEAQGAAPDSPDEPPARASPDERRLRLGVEQPVARFQRSNYEYGSQYYLSWGFGPTELAVDYRVVAGLETGLAVGVNGARESSEFFGGGESESSSLWLTLNPRVGYAIELAPTLSVVPRVGLEYVRGSTNNSFVQFDGSVMDQTHTNHFLSFASGVLLEHRPVPWLFVGPQVDFGYQMHTSFEGAESSWFSEQPAQVWRLDLKIAAGVRI